MHSQFAAHASAAAFWLRFRFAHPTLLTARNHAAVAIFRRAAALTAETVFSLATELAAGPSGQLVHPVHLEVAPALETLASDKLVPVFNAQAAARHVV